jgi:ketosteroid isomerase-like protein
VAIVPLPAIAGLSYVGPPATCGVYHAYSRAVSDERIESLRRLVGMWNSGAIDELLEELGPDFEFTTDPSFPDAGTYRGDAVGPWMHEWAASWQDAKLEFIGFTEYGRAVLADSRWHLAALRSGDVVPVSDFSLVFRFDREEDDRPTAMTAFFDRERAVEEAKQRTG